MKRLSRAEKRIFLYLIAVALMLSATLLGLLLGSVRLSPKELFEAVFGGSRESAAARIFWYVRFPRVAATLLCGGALALSGAVIQGVLANRLASPSIIGVNSGAGLAVTLCAAVGVIGGWRLSAFAFLGAFLTVLIISLGAKRWGASHGPVILMGVALNALFGAISDSVTVFFPDLAILRNDFKIGDFSAVTYPKLIPAAVVILAASILLLLLSGELDVLTLGEEQARGLGMNTALMRLVFLLLSALLAGAAVSVAGLLSFVGLLVPHAVRRMMGGNAHLLPLSLLFGAGFVALCDALSRILFAPYEVPVGILMAFLGAPFFLFILIKGKGGEKNRD